MSGAQWWIVAAVALLAISRLGARLLRVTLIVVVGAIIAVAAGVPLGPLPLP